MALMTVQWTTLSAMWTIGETKTHVLQNRLHSLRGAKTSGPDPDT
jgi:hypothetical protein